jgi:lauroyl/myristoyl acyltransferase
MRRFIAGRSIAHHGPGTEAITYAFEKLLGESATAARRLLDDWFFYKRLENESWSKGRTSHGWLLDAQTVGAYLKECPRGIVIATIHLGDYLEGLRQLLGSVGQRQVFVVRRKAWSELEQRAFARIAPKGLVWTVLRTGSGAAATAVRELRRGNVLIMLFDLPHDFGPTVEVDFFGQRAHFVRGPAEVALLGAADVLPVFTHYEERGRSVVEAMPVIVARPCSRGTRARRVEEISQQLCKWAEQSIRRYPAQWANWLWIRELMVRPDQSQRDAAAMSPSSGIVKTQ